jgi:glutathione synthase/RimK-type ligase-like ATP-grasp enzyme
VTVLVSGIVADEMVELMCARLASLGVDHLLVDLLRFPGDIEVTWTADGDGPAGHVSVDGRTVALEDVSGVYARYVDYRRPEAPDDLDERERALVDAEHQVALMQLYDLLPCVVVNRARCSLSNDSKPYQRLVLEEAGFATPRTLLTTVPDEARAFHDACGGRVIYKSLSGTRSVVGRLDAAGLARLELVRNCPTQFQEHVAGVDVRVHTVGDEVFATEIVSDATDYRYPGDAGERPDVRPVELPGDVAARCVALGRQLGLEVAGIDLRRTPDGRYVCFEVNPSPGFLFYERAAGQPISAAVARLLAGAARPAAERGEERDHAR